MGGLSAIKVIEPFRLPHHRMFLDIHFFFIAARHMQYWIRKLKDQLGDPCLDEVWSKYKPGLMALGNARRFLEHLGREIELGAVNLGNVGEMVFEYESGKVDLGPEALHQIQDLYEAVVACIRQRPLPFKMPSC